MNQRIPIAEMSVRSLVGANNMDAALFHAVEYYKDYIVKSASLEGFKSTLDEQSRLVDVLRNIHAPLIYGQKLYLVTLQLVKYLELTDDDATYVNTGLDQKPGVPVAGDSEAEGDGDTESRFRGPPTEA